MILTGLGYLFHMPMPHLFSAVSVTDSEEKCEVRTASRTPKTLLRCNAFMHATPFFDIPIAIYSYRLPPIDFYVRNVSILQRHFIYSFHLFSFERFSKIPENSK